MALERAGVVHGRLEILGSAKLHVDANVIRKAADEELSPLQGLHTWRVTRQGLEAVGEILHRGGERQTAQLGQSAPA